MNRLLRLNNRLGPGLPIAVLIFLPMPCWAQGIDSTEPDPFKATVTRYEGGTPPSGIGKIINGKISDWNTTQWQVALLVAWIADPAQAQFCGGSLIRPNWVLTAAHCVAGNTTSRDVHVLSGTANLNSGGLRSNVETIFVHKRYAVKPPNYDVALLKLKREGLGQTIGLIQEKDEDAVVIEPAKVRVTGWGVTETGQRSTVLKEIDVPVVSRRRCNSPPAYDGKISDLMMCAGIDQGGQDSCQGDSGGPASIGGRLVGVVSWGAGCAQPFKYGVYANVAKLSAWANGCIADESNCEATKK